MVSIRTKFHGPTNTRGSRISAFTDEPRDRRRITLSWDHALDVDENHKTAAAALIRQLGWTADQGYGPWIVGGTANGYVFVCQAGEWTVLGNVTMSDVSRYRWIRQEE